MSRRPAATIDGTNQASPQSWLSSFLGRGIFSRGHASLKRLLRSAAFFAWMFVLLPGSLLASWEAPRSELSGTLERIEMARHWPW